MPALPQGKPISSKPNYIPLIIPLLSYIRTCICVKELHIRTVFHFRLWHAAIGFLSRVLKLKDIRSRRKPKYQENVGMRWCSPQGRRWSFLK